MFSSGRLEALDTPGVEDRPPGPPEPAESLSLSRTGLTHVADCIFGNSTLKYLYLEDNHISALPHSFFISLPKLLWLDLRNNQITSLPAQIGSHRSLKTLLLEGNPISELPPELGHVISLSGLNLRSCPIVFPPPDVVDQGVQSILQYLRSAMATRPLTVRTTPSLGVPAVEKLQLSESMESSGEDEQEPVDEVELQRFRELKHKMILLDEAELGSAAPRNNKSHLPAPHRKKAASGAGLIPELPLFGGLRLKNPERRQMGKKPSLPEQRRRCLEAPHHWGAESRITREKRICNPWKSGKERRAEEIRTDLAPLVKDGDDSQGPPEQEKARSARALEQHICSLVYGLQPRSGGPPGTSTQQMALAERGVKEDTRGLRARLLEKKNRRCGEKGMNAADAWHG